ncbi:hypothetical protein I302_100316 [Kwoniella bestiolae CBS 10118]|uniref:Nudix hydrolase domain-containing protein n=1 Tax=Kwoniella bestiolae CBS 10118 TaxID=1296100 RepID=A0A1B9G4T1_9TREE|nr:hypothetical protein I302_03688 [Kwoniella bestiolae CBS 10118]OCF26011.1 hypothetical protein I302_03688 [Kwoniella bestiolae CBS 10118]
MPPQPLEPFCTAILRTLRRSLIPPNLPRPLPAHTHTAKSHDKTKSPSESAILIPLMNIRDQPHILMEVRGKGLRVHAGEVSFPGGKADKTDDSLIHTALRETQEELSIPTSHVEILGMLEPEYSLGNKSRVWPFVGFIHSDPQPFPSIPQTLPSLPLSQITPNPDEVSSIITLPLSALRDPQKLAVHYFRLNLNRPYYRVGVQDYMIDKEHTTKTNTLRKDEKKIDGGENPIRSVGVEENGESSEKLEVWGLSGWFLNRLAQRAGWLDSPPKGVSPED